MLNVHIICPGKIKERYLSDAVSEYMKRLGAYCKPVITELSPERLPDNPSPAQINNALEREAVQILAAVPQGAYVYALCVEGRQLSSEELSRSIAEAAVAGKSTLAFIIGSSHGLADSIKAGADVRLSFSKMTFPHQLMRVMLTEQLYRAMSISRGGKYHK